MVAAVVGTAIHRLALALRPHVEPRLLLATPLVGLAIGALAIIYAQATGHDVSDVLFSGQDSMGPLISTSADYSVAALVLLATLLLASDALTVMPLVIVAVAYVASARLTPPAPKPSAPKPSAPTPAAEAPPRAFPAPQGRVP
jgi:hypothetical protein